MGPIAWLKNDRGEFLDTPVGSASVVFVSEEQSDYIKWARTSVPVQTGWYWCSSWTAEHEPCESLEDGKKQVVLSLVELLTPIFSSPELGFVQAVFDAVVPKNDAFCVERNSHQYYSGKSALEWAEERCLDYEENWVNPKEKEKTVATNELWKAQWFEGHPIESRVMLASSLPVLLSGLIANKRGEQ